MIALIGEVTGRYVLDVGYGPGALTVWLADHGAVVTGVDVSSAMLAIASERLGGTWLVLADASRPFAFLEDASMDLVVASLFLHYVHEWVCRCCVSGGDFSSRAAPQSSAATNRAWTRNSSARRTTSRSSR